MTTYTGSDGRVHALDSMALPHLKSATAKLAAGIEARPERRSELAAMQAELERRETKFAADVAFLQTQGFAVWPHGTTEWQIRGPLGSYFTKLFKTEDGAWAALIADREQ